MRFRTITAFVLTLPFAVCAAADAFSDLTGHMSLARHGNVIVATNAPPEEAAAYARRISAYDSQIRRRYFPSLDDRPVRFIIGDDTSQLVRLVGEPPPGTSAPSADAYGYYRRNDRIIVASTAHGDGAVLRELTRALVHADNPDAPHWFETAMASLYESRDIHAAALTPILDDRMAQIAVDEDLDYDVFAGICDCYQLTTEQLALMRLLLVFLHQRDELTSLYEAVELKGRYVTLLQSLDAMRFDRAAWKAYARQSVEAFWKSRDGNS